MAGGHYQQGPMVRWALENDGACSWRWMQDLAQADMLTDGEKMVIAFNQSMDVTAGYTVSFRSVSHRTKGAIALTAKPGMTQDEIEVWNLITKWVMDLPVWYLGQCQTFCSCFAGCRAAHLANM